MSDVTKIKLPDNSEYNIKDYRIPGVDTTPTSGSDNIVTSGGIYTAITENELTTASALNDLDDRITTIEEDIVTDTDLLWERGTGTNSVVIKNSLGNAGGNNSTVEGKGCVTGGSYETNTLTPDTADSSAGSYGHAEGRYTIASGIAGSHAEGNRTLASNIASHAEGQRTIASGSRSHAEGNITLASGTSSHAEGNEVVASGEVSHAEGGGTIASGNYSHSEGRASISSGAYAHAEGFATLSKGSGSHADGFGSNSIGGGSHAECGNWWYHVLLTGGADATQYDVIEDEGGDDPLHVLYNDLGSEMFTNLLLNARIGITENIAQTITPITAVTNLSLVNNVIHMSITVEKTLSSTALTNASGGRINITMAYGANSHSEASVSWGTNTHAEGVTSVAIGNTSHSEGMKTITRNLSEHAEGSYNVSNKASDTYGNAGNTQHSIGIGSASSRKNAVEVMQNGDVYVYGVGSYNGTNPSSASTLQSVLNAGGSGSGITTETDPVFTASAAYGITSSDITNWNSKTSNTGTLTGVSFNGASATITSGVAEITASIPTVESLTTSEIDTIWTNAT